MDRLRASAVWVASRAALALHAAFQRPRTNGFGILMYHRLARQSLARRFGRGSTPHSDVAAAPIPPPTLTFEEAGQR